jgi:uncharacterized membrane protein
MDWYLVVRFIHIVAAMAWLGGALAMLVASALAARDPDFGARLRFMAMVNALGLPFFVPASMTVLVSGVVMAALWTGFSQAWLVLALAGIAVSIGIGVGFIKPVGERISARATVEGASPAVRADIDLMTRVTRFDYAIMLAIVALMVFKPGWQDTATLFALAVLIAGSAAILFTPRRSRAVSMAA